jgi:hypothetical protein
MKTEKPHSRRSKATLAVMALLLSSTAGTQHALATEVSGNPKSIPSKKTQAIPWDQLGAKAGADYHGDGLAVRSEGSGARLHCLFQRIDGEATGEGLWLVSTVTNHPGERFRVVAAAVGRGEVRTQSGLARTLSLPGRGTVTVDGQTVRYIRPGLVEEYSVSMDGVRQDFVVPERPPGDGQLEVQLAVSGARVEVATYGAQLLLEQSGRKLAYSRLHATDANGKQLPARIQLVNGGDRFHSVPDVPNEEWDAVERVPASAYMSVLVNDAGAVYPVRIDPTVSDANWSPLGSGINGDVYALAVSGGTLYAGGNFSTPGYMVAQWDGSSWSGMGGVSGTVNALAVSADGTVYAGGEFKTANGNLNLAVVYYIAQWNGSSWSALGKGMNNWVSALAVSGSTLYASGYFNWATNSDGVAVAANYIAQWNGSSWSALGNGLDNFPVYALAVSGGTLYAGGNFDKAGGNAAKYLAQWNGTNWSALGSGLQGGGVTALAVSGSTLYAGGYFTNAGGITVNHIAQWNGSSWSALGSGLSWDGHGVPIGALAVSDGMLYAGGIFLGINAIAQWNGCSWSTVGSGLTGTTWPCVYALAVSGGTLYAGGDFNISGDLSTELDYIAQWTVSNSSAPPGPATLLTPANAAGSQPRRPEFSWTQPCPPATWFQLYVTRNGSEYLDQWMEGATNWTPTADLPGGSYSWWVETYSSGGLGPWSTSSSFTVPVTIPSSIVLVLPLGSASPATTQLYVWQADPAASWYELYVVQNGRVLCDQWFTLSNSVAPPFAVRIGGHTGGNYEWWVRGWSPDGLGPWSNMGSYTMNAPQPPGPVTLLAPANTASFSIRQPELTWTTTSPAADWYYLYLTRNGSKYLDQWVEGTTSWVVTSGLPGGTYNWWVLPWNAVGYGQWSTNFSFTIPPAVPVAITLISPSGSVAAGSTQLYTWQADAAATWYELYVSTGGSVFCNNWYTLSNSVAGSGTGDFAVDVNGHSSGTYYWWVRGWGPDGMGPWSSSLTFQIP